MYSQSKDADVRARSGYAKRPLPEGNRLIRFRDRDLARRNGNSTGVPYPSRGRRAWLEALADVRYGAEDVGWKTWKR